VEFLEYFDGFDMKLSKISIPQWLVFRKMSASEILNIVVGLSILIILLNAVGAREIGIFP